MTDSDTSPPAELLPGATAAAKPRRRVRWLAAILVVLLALAGGGGVVAWPWVARLLAPPPAGPTTTELAGEVATLGDEVATLRQRIAAVEQRQAQPAAADAGLAQRVAALEAAPTAAPHLAEDVKAQGERLAAVEKNAADATTVLRLADRLDKAEAGLRDLQSRRNAAGAMLLAVGQLRQAVDMALPFAAELAAVGALAPPQAATAAAVAALQPRAATGIPGRPALVAQFVRLEPAIVRADLLPGGDGWWQRTLARVSTLVSVRREDGDAEGNSAAAVAARVEARLAEGDLAAALTAAARFGGGAATVAAPWADDVRDRLAADRALSELAAQAVTSSVSAQ